MVNKANQALYQRLEQAARAGRVQHSGFLEPEDAAELAARLRSAGVSLQLSGGYNGAKRRVVTVFPEHIPHADTALEARYFSSLEPSEASSTLQEALRTLSLSADAVGDMLEHDQGVVLIVLASVSPDFERLAMRLGNSFSNQPLDLAALSQRASKTQQVVVPSLRVDVVGAKAFKVSRGYFSKGIASGNVYINGSPASKASQVDVGDEVYAEGLGRCSVQQVGGETKKGNLKITLHIERTG